MNAYFTGEFSARRPITIVGGLVLTAVGVCLAGIWMPQMKRQMDISHVTGALCALLFILVFLGSGSFLLYKIAKNQKTVLKITSDGVAYGGKMYHWEDVTEIGIMQKYTSRKDLYCTTRLHPWIVELPLSRGLRPEHIVALFRVIRSEVIPLHSHICLRENDDEK